MRNIEEKFRPTVSKLKRKFKRQLELTKSDLKSVLKPHGNRIDEDAPTNSAGAGNIDGIGVGDKGEPGISKRARPRILRRKEAEAAQHNQEVKAWRKKAVVESSDEDMDLTDWARARIVGSDPLVTKYWKAFKKQGGSMHKFGSYLHGLRDPNVMSHPKLPGNLRRHMRTKLQAD